MPHDVSVAMATYNGARFLAEQLDSLVAQTLRPVEIVICDDGSTDATPALVADYARTCPITIRFVANATRLGWRANFMKAAALCRGDLIAFCDQDDVWLPSKLAETAACLDDGRTLLVFHDATVVDIELKPLSELAQCAGGPDSAEAMGRSPWLNVLGFSQVFSRELLAFWPLWDGSVDKSVPTERAPHDQWVMFLASTLGTTRHLARALALYRQHGGNVVGVQPAAPRQGRLTAVFQSAQLAESRLRVLESRTAALAEIAEGSGPLAQAAVRALSVHSNFRDLLRAQCAVYGARRADVRARALLRLLRRGAYSGDRWALTRPMAGKDLAAAMLGPAGLNGARRLLAGAAASTH